MFTDAYQTSQLNSYMPDSIKKDIKISANLSDEDGPFRLKEFGIGKPVMALTGPDRDIAAFSHPLIMHGRDWGFYHDTVVFDARGFVSIARDGTVTIRNKDEFDFHSLRARLTHYGLTNHFADLAAVGNFPMQVFVTWLSETITRRFAIDPMAQQKTQSIIAIYYISLFKDAHELVKLSDSSIARYTQLISRLFRLNADVVLALFRELPPLTTVHDLISALKKYGGSDRYEQLNIGILYTIVGSAWWGAQSKEILAVALEHPPTWIALVATVLTATNYRKTDLALKAERVNKQEAGNDYLRGLYRLPGLKSEF